jgi:cytochrome c553
VGAFPALAGKDAAYLIDQMKNYKTGARQSPMMVPIAQGLTDEEIADLAGYYSLLKPSD